MRFWNGGNFLRGRRKMTPSPSESDINSEELQEFATKFAEATRTGGVKGQLRVSYG